MRKLPLAVALAAFIATPVLAQDSPTLKKIKDSNTITIGHPRHPLNLRHRINHSVSGNRNTVRVEEPARFSKIEAAQQLANNQDIRATGDLAPKGRRRLNSIVGDRRAQIRKAAKCSAQKKQPRFWP